jgi:c-di-GMP phosphodiesterase
VSQTSATIDSTPTAAATPYIARQAILDPRGTVHGYRIIPALDSSPAGLAGAASYGVVQAVSQAGVSNLVGNRPAYIGVTIPFLESGLFNELPSEQIVYELDVRDLAQPSDNTAILEAVRAKGYRIALDGVTPRNLPTPLMSLADVVGVDVFRAPTALSLDLVASSPWTTRRVCATGVETADQFSTCRDHFTLFRGSYYQRPTMSPGNAVSASRLATMQIIAECANPNASIDSFESIVSRDPKLAFMVLELANSAGFGSSRRIESLRQAMVMIGVNELRNLSMVASLGGLQNTPPELLRSVMLRAKLSELLARSVKADHAAAFTAGLLSLLDAFIAIPLEEALERVSLSKELQVAILNHSGRIGDVLRMSIACETATFPSYAEPLIPIPQASAIYLDALAWVESFRAKA